MRTPEFREDMSDEEVFHVSRNRALLAKDDRCQRTDHPQRTFLLPWRLLVVWGGLIFADNAVDETKD